VRRSVLLCCVAALIPLWYSTVDAQAKASKARAEAVASAPHRDAASDLDDRTAGGDVQPLDRRVSLDLTNVPLRDALREIDRKAQLGLAYTPRIVPVNKRVTIKADSITAGEALERVLRGTGIVAVMTTSETVMLVKAQVKHAELPVSDSSGFAYVLVHVTDSVADRAARSDTASKKEIIGATVSVKGLKISMQTREQGYAVLQHVPSGLRTITVRFLGYTPVERTIVVPDTGYIRVDVAMQMGMTRLQEVVTTATGQQRRYELANDITKLDVDSIVRTQPISSVTDLLEGRVPGLTVQHTSGAPGDPSRLRLRGTSSMLRNNDPIVIVDGVRVYSAQSDSTSANLASGRGAGGNILGGTLYTAAPSPLDQIDPQAIQTIEVLKGPSAATLYGPDAANGVIVITMKKGRAGPARWSVNATHGLSYMPGKYPEGLYRWGTDLRNFSTVLCPLSSFSCRADSLVRFQALNDDRYTLLKQGGSSSLSLGVSGGSEALTYAITGSYDNDEGILSLPGVEATRFTNEHGSAPFSWMTRPQQLRRWSGTSRLSAKLGAKTDASLTMTLTRESQQRSSLDQDLATLMTTYIDASTGTYWRAQGLGLSTTNELLPDFYQRTTDDATNFTNAANFNWRPLSWLTTSADAGLNVISRQDDQLLPRGFLPNSDSAGRLFTGSGSTVVSTINLRATGTAPLPWGFHLQLSTGANYTRTSASALETGVNGLAPGTSSVNGAEQIMFSTQNVSDITSFGWYIEPDFTHDRFTITTGLRLDGSSTFGSNVSVPIFPKVGVSWLISQEPFFPFKRLFDVFRVRAAYGRAGVWPGPADRLRLYSSSRPWEDGGFVDVTQVSTIGNSQIRPERSSEVEGGFDADFVQGRLSVGFSGYRKMRFDALEHVPVAPSVYGANVQELLNIGTIRNTGIEATVTGQLIRSDPVTWSASLNLTRNHNLVTKLGDGVLPFGSNDARVVAGYPLFSRWARPILGFSDANHDGIIERNEVLLGDTLVFMGGSEPNYEANLFSTLSLFRGTVTVSGGLSYQAGLTQINQTIGTAGQAIFSPGTSDPKSSLGEQAAVVVMNETQYGLMQTVSTWRIMSLAVAYNLSPEFAARFGARALSVALEGTNLGLFTNYKGKDPNVNAFATGNSTLDTGVLPLPRAWSLAVHATY
jgi:TonB-linked SusC/RagA family outer membrane protein